MAGFAPVARTSLHGMRRLMQGPWPLLWGAVALAIANFATLYLAGRPWGITSAFAAVGIEDRRPFGGFDVSLVALLARAGSRAACSQQERVRGRHLGDGFRHPPRRIACVGSGRQIPLPTWRVAPSPAFVAAIVGGLLLGYGARLAYGCNIGAYFSGIASGSLHGWCWFVAAFVGNILGTWVRPLFGARGGADARPDTPRIGGMSRRLAARTRPRQRATP